ncbi:hypothetical protein JCM8208_004641 [Rhodotorula glutinis]
MPRATSYSGPSQQSALRRSDSLDPPARPASRSFSTDATPDCRGYGDEWAADGNDRLSSRHLGLGALSFGIFAIRDTFSGYIVALECVPDACDPDSLAHIFLDAVEEEQGVPANVVVDNGAENDKLLQVQITLHTQVASQQELDSPSSFERKTPNASLLNLWSQWMRVEGRLLQRAIQDKAELAGFDPDDDLHLATALLVWRSVIQGRLDLFRRTANMIRVRRQPNKVAGLIAGHIPELARRGWHGGERCIVPCDLGVVRQLHGLVGPRLTFVEPEFDAAAVRAHEEMGAPDLLRTTAWDVWAELVKRLS